ncbi:MAG: phosphoribosyltransferase [Thermoprotei archaeon]|nr:MAG: phosphoribosyltransferase [Thermoprotei archaeon]
MLIDNSFLRERVGVFENREDAGRRLASFLNEKGIFADVVAAIPNGGVPVGYHIARSLNAEFRAAVVKKVLFPWTSEAGFGAVSWTNHIALDERAILDMGLSDEEVDLAVKKALKEVKERSKLFKKFLPKDVKNKSVVVVDDGLATGYTMLVAVKSVRALGASKVIVACPTASSTSINVVSEAADIVVVLNLRSGVLFAVADAYKNWYDLRSEEALIYFLNFCSKRQV